MPSEPFHNALYDIRDNILLAQEFVSGMDYASFTASRRDVYAVTRAIEIISEASKRLPESLRARHPHMPWRGIRDVGNFYRHKYDNVAESYVWRTVHDHLPPLLAVVISEIAVLEAGA
jgi:uncharacterized protein with HEPN domain